MCKSDEVWAEIDMHIKVITPQAIGFAEDLDGEVDLWLPLSQTSQLTTEDGDIDPEDAELEDLITHARMPEWLAEAKDLTYE